MSIFVNDCTDTSHDLLGFLSLVTHPSGDSIVNFAGETPIGPIGSYWFQPVGINRKWFKI